MSFFKPAPAVVVKVSPSNCECSEQQLHLVGCDCRASSDAVIVDVYLRGYASDDKGRLHCDGGLDVEAEVRRAFGYSARAFRTRRVFEMPKPSVSAAERQYWSGDNS